MRSMLAPLCSALVAILAAHGVAHAQNPAWPNRSATRAEMSDPANWPDDPSYGYDVSGTGSTCIPGTTRCFTNPTGGQWNLWSWTPAEATARDTFRAPEADLGSGAWTDMAWTLTTGSRRVLIAILDSRINWDEGDLTNQYYINRAELEAPGLDPRLVSHRILLHLPLLPGKFACATQTSCRPRPGFRPPPHAASIIS